MVNSQETTRKLMKAAQSQKLCAANHRAVAEADLWTKPGLVSTAPEALA